MKLAIQGHPTRGKEVIQILESLGGRNGYDQSGSNEEFVYFINSVGFIYSVTLIMCSNECRIYTLEEFEKEFPFKVGDKVTFKKVDIRPYTIKSFSVWSDGDIVCEFEETMLHYPLHELKPYKETKEERNITLTLDKAKEWYKKGGELKEIALQAFSEKELIEVELPESWEEFCENFPVKKGECFFEPDDEICVTSLDGRKRTNKDWITSKKSAEAHLAMIQLEQLRDCYRGLFITVIGMPVWNINMYDGKPHIFQAVWGKNQSFLSFQSKEVAEKYLENFKPLIEKAGDLI